MELLINIDVPDLAAAEAFYTAAFALRPARRFGGDAIELLGANVPIYLLHTPAGSTAAGDAKRGYARHWTPLHSDLAVEDLDAAVQRAVDAGDSQAGPLPEDTVIGRATGR